jgi:hypothetical protein
MARTRSLDDLIADLRYLADVEGAELRHSDAKLTREINQSIQRFREWVTEEGFGLYLTPYTVNLTTGATSPYVWREVDLSALNPAVAHVQAVECIADGQAYDLDKVPFESRNDYLQQNGVPAAWIQYGDVIGILPPPQSEFPITVWYLGVFVDLVAGSDTFDGMVGWEEWVRWNSLIPLLTRDQYPGLIDNAVARCEQLKAEFKTKLRGDRPSVARRRDVRGGRVGSFPLSRRLVFGGGGIAGGPGIFDSTFDWSYT